MSHMFYGSIYLEYVLTRINYYRTIHLDRLARLLEPVACNKRSGLVVRYARILQRAQLMCCVSLSKRPRRERDSISPAASNRARNSLGYSFRFGAVSVATGLEFY